MSARHARLVSGFDFMLLQGAQIVLYVSNAQPWSLQVVTERYLAHCTGIADILLNKHGLLRRKVPWL